MRAGAQRGRGEGLAIAIDGDARDRCLIKDVVKTAERAARRRSSRARWSVSKHDGAAAVGSRTRGRLFMMPTSTATAVYRQIACKGGGGTYVVLRRTPR